MDQLEKVVRAITKAASKDAGGEVVAFGTRDDQPLSDQWEIFFRKSRESLGLRKQEPAPEGDEADSDVLPEILARIIKRIEEIEARLALIETVDEIEEAIDQEPELVRKGLDPETFLLKMELEGAHGELRDREGRSWQRS